MAQAILTCERKVWLVATGPLTNVALLLSLFPEVEERLEGISIMGGAWERGNRSPVAEFKYYFLILHCHCRRPSRKRDRVLNAEY